MWLGGAALLALGFRHGHSLLLIGVGGGSFDSQKQAHGW